MPMPLRFLESSRPSVSTAPIPVDNITDPHARRTAELRNAELEKLQKAKELEQRTRVECQQALDQYDVLKKIPTLTEQERKENETLTKKKIAKAIIAAQKASQAVMDARVIMGAKGEELTK
ncbi:uncharacterized protein CELE_T08A9.13 [Caenorhabditis elegans]|uniref:Uncharacterized protein n=1 Tax=Caenorhabditis elegans TaxID=6239 RepID=Q22339_CAEEL|nr:Uncharacterized protein CELE_T08A9.13 [Caenorhabditis elegans]CCD63526.1 Uncharacterized protein CELE_T08A9.13 [Caenorhabditis elegans]|eukprot:NP_001033559.1 Uncharacterized protein CELE_T08A9.13 [Caenorhabditis elegans]